MREGNFEYARRALGIDNQFFDGQVRFAFENNKTVSIRVIGDNDEDGTEEALAKVAQLKKFLDTQGVQFHYFERKYKEGRAVDCILLAFA